MTLLRTMAFATGLACLAAGSAAAQLEDEHAPIIVGPMAGVSFSTLRGAGVGDADVRAGFLGGGFVTISISPNFAVEPQVFYVQKGANYHADSAGTQLSSSRALSYIEIPLLFKARYPVGTARWPLIVSAIAGPAIAIRTGCTYTDPSGAQIDCGKQPGTDSNMQEVQVANLDLSASFGVGLDFSHFAFQARYDYSFTNLFTYPNVNYPYTTDIKNQAWFLTLGYKIAID